MPKKPASQPHRPSSITTRGGDGGTTGLLYGQRVSKAHPQIEAIGTLDELNVAIGAAKLAARPHTPLANTASDCQPVDTVHDTRCLLDSIQQTLVALMGEVACAADAIDRYEKSKFEKPTEADLARVDEKIAALEARGLVFDGWARPGANALAISYDQARVTARRAERRLVALAEQGRALRPLLVAYINRLSDLLWLLAREAEAA